MSKEKQEGKKVVLITGGASDTGKVLATRLAGEGHQVIITVREQAQTHRLIEDRKSKGTGFQVEVLDVTSPTSISGLIGIVTGQFGRIDVLINQIGYGLAGPIEDTSPEEAHTLFDLNFMGVHRVIRSVLPVMRQHHDGLIINMTSEFGNRGIPMLGFYCASKFALEAYSEALLEEVKPHNIRVCLVQPAMGTSTLSKKIELSVQSVSEHSPYYHRTTGMLRQLRMKYRTEAEPERIAGVIAGLIGEAKPRFRNLVE
ncbi:MAG: SDR family oxidoreductase [Bacteroidetes bacterium]|nr:SDR family oxidoreductase [Bacteroidota bacterium]